MRVYLATTIAGLEALRRTGFDAPREAHAVTGALREAYAEGDADELEYAAAADAAHASLRLLDPAARARRVVVAAEVPDASVRPQPGEAPSSVLLSAVVTREHVVSLHADDAEAEADVAAAVAALAAADAGDDDAQFTVDGAEGHELLWYDVTELDNLLDDPLDDPLDDLLD